MKHSVIAFLILIFAATLIPCVSVMAQIIYPPHEDPAFTEGVMDAYSFLTYYADILTLLSSKEYENATRLIEQLKNMYVTEDLQYIIERYNNLTLEFIDVLDELEKLLDEASLLLNQYRLDEAYQKLEEAGILLSRANILLRELQDATETLSELLGVFAAPAESKVREAYNKLQSLFQRLRELLDEYLRLLKNITTAALEIKREELKPTEITLNLNTTSVCVGSFVNASGILRSDGEGMQNRTVTVLLDEENIATAATSLNGSYYTLIQIPYRYVHVMTVKALYTPIGNDTGIYLGSISPQVSIEVLFCETYLETTTPAEAHPGLPITARGEVTSEDGFPLSERKVEVLFEGDILAKAETNASGLFEIRETLNPQTPTGESTLTIVVEPKGVYAGTSQSKILIIVKITCEIDLHVPSFVVLPAEMHVHGSVGSVLGPLQKATVTLEMGGSSAITKTSENGEFNVTLNMPLSPVSVGFQEIKVAVEPAEPWHASVQTKASVFIVNPANIGLASAAFISVGAVLYTRLSRFRTKREEAEVLEVPPPLEKSAAPSFLLKHEAKLRGVKGRVLEAYAKALKTVEAVTEISIKPHQTLREFLLETRPKVDDAFDSFSDLTILAERALYSPYEPDADEAVKAENLVLNIERVLKGGTA